MLIFLVILLSVAVYTDFKTGKIPNILIIVGSIAGIAIGQPPANYLLRAILIIVLFFPFFLIRALGAGDIKCFSMIALYLDSGSLLFAILYTFLIAAMCSAFTILKKYFKNEEVKSLRCINIHLALPILVGVLISIGGDSLCTIF